VSLHNFVAYLPQKGSPADCGGVWVLVRSLNLPPDGVMGGHLTAQFGSGRHTNLCLNLTGPLVPEVPPRPWHLNLDGGQPISLPLYLLPLPAEALDRIHAHLETFPDRLQPFHLSEAGGGPGGPVHEFILILTWEAL
jgi:hypothetical protein